jgi:hypothetical protein
MPQARLSCSGASPQFTAAGEDMSDHLKYFTEHLPATFAYAGIDVPSRLSGIRGACTATSQAPCSATRSTSTSAPAG